MKKLIVLVVILLGTFVFHGVCAFMKERPETLTEDDESLLGERVADILKKKVSEGDRISVLTLYPQDIDPYSSRTETIEDEFEDRLDMLDARAEGVYNDDNYAPAIDRVIEQYPGNRHLVILAVGSVTHADVTDRLSTFLEDGGMLYLVGDTSPRGALLKLVEHQQVSCVFKRSNWLKTRFPAPENPADYVEKHYVTIQNGRM